jgi:ATP-binding cassette, subfamily B, bacterial PglK
MTLKLILRYLDSSRSTGLAITYVAWSFVSATLELIFIIAVSLGFSPLETNSGHASNLRTLPQLISGKISTPHILVIIFLVVGLAFFVKLYLASLQKNLTAKLSTRLSSIAYSRLIVKNNAADLDIAAKLNITLNHTNIFMASVLQGVLSIIPSIFLVLGITAIFVVSFPPAFIAFLLLAAIAACLAYNYIHRRESSLIQVVNNEQKKLIRTSQDSLHDIRSIYCYQLSDYFERSYNITDVRLRNAYSKALYWRQLPKICFDSAIGAMVATALLFTLLSGSNGAEAENSFVRILIISILGVSRITPGIVSIGSNLSSIISSSKVVRPLFQLANDSHPSNPLIPSRRYQKLNREQWKLKHLIVSDLSFKYKNSRKNVLSDISFSLSKNDRMLIVGPSGSGKSTLLDLIVGHSLPTGGTISSLAVRHINNDQLITLESSYIPSVLYSICSQTCYPPSCPLIEFLLPYSVQGDNLNQALMKAVNILKKVQLYDLARELERDKYFQIPSNASTLSGGQKTRLSLARALANKSAVLILDEPFTGLDEKTIDAITEILNSLNDIAILVVTHHIPPDLKYNKILQMH